MSASEIAEVLRTERQHHEGFRAQVYAIDNVALAFATALGAGDSHFNKTTFLAECGAPHKGEST